MRDGIKTLGVGIGSPEAGVTGGCELPWVGAGSELSPLQRAAQLRCLSSLALWFFSLHTPASLAGKLLGYSPVSTSHFSLAMPSLQPQVTVFSVVVCLFVCC